MTTTFATLGGGATIANRLYGGSGPAIVYLVKLELQEQTAGAAAISDGAALQIDIPATVPVGTRYEYTFGDGYRLGGDLVMGGVGTRSGTITYYVGP